MTKDQRLYKKATEAWIKTVETSIKSCDMAITHARQNIDLSNEKIKHETAQKLAMQSQLVEAKRNAQKHLK